ncbi:putative extracellular nuclease [Natronospira proteinivora]|uniref:Extracellular nuclease n=1 Tax=Natronospira proteinivora TaxID=1807133 RepID=A0ABT1G5R2_9GAMM|nr:ExeM/NucH family extracellular endonuclease [Natronospira proteinivora]MCP1726280.1 putative extracellular nuclease [Natronospira proteinivora]
MKPWIALLVLLATAPLHADCPDTGLTSISDLRAAETAEWEARWDGENLLVRGVVTGTFLGDERLNGFYLQSPPESATPPRAIFVYAPSLDEDLSILRPGQEILVAGRAGRFRGQRQINRVQQVLGCAEPGLPEPHPLDLPVAERDNWRDLEGVLVQIERTLTITGNYELARYGSLELSVGGRLFRPRNIPDQDWEAMAKENRARRIILDDANYNRNPDPIPYLNDQGSRRVGDQLPELTGILTHAFDAWRIHPLNPETLAFESANPRPAAPERQGRYRLAAFNVENYFLTLGERGASDSATLDRQRSALAAVARGLDADLLGLVEIENKPEAVDDLVTRLSDDEQPYRHFDLDEPVGTDAIRTALAWRPDQVSLLAGPFIDERQVHHRPLIAGHFRFRDEGPGKLVVVIHFKAKTACPDEGDIDRGQGCWNERRTAQARALVDFLEEKMTATGTDRVLILGDINSYGGEDPVTVLREAGLRDLVAQTLPREARYSYVFHGESGYLDTAIASPALKDDVRQVDFWSINADEPTFLQFQDSAPWRSSDHDPVIVDLD